MSFWVRVFYKKKVASFEVTTKSPPSTQQAHYQHSTFRITNVSGVSGPVHGTDLLDAENSLPPSETNLQTNTVTLNLASETAQVRRFNMSSGLP